MARRRSLEQPSEASPRANSSASGAPQQTADRVLQRRPGVQQAVLFGAVKCIAKRSVPAADDRDLVHRVGLGKFAGDQGVSGLMEGDAILLLAAKQALALFRTGDQALDPFLELGEADGRLAAAGRQQGRLVDEIGQVGADEARRDRRDLAQVDCFFERDGARGP